MNSSIFDWTIEIAGEAEEKQGDFPTNLASDALARFFTLLGLKTNEKGNSIPLFRTGQQEIRLLILTPYSTKTLEEYFKNLLLGAYGKETMDLSNQRFLFIDSKRENQSDRFFHVMGSIFKHAKIGRKVDLDKLLTIFSSEFKWNEDNSKHETKTEDKLRLRNSIEETCFATGVEEMREFLFRTSAASTLHNLFHNIPEEWHSALRLIVGSYLAGDISLKILEIVLSEFLTDKENPFAAITHEVEKEIKDRMKNPLWKYLENRKILIIEDRLEKKENGWEGWDIVFPALFLSPEKYLKASSKELPSSLFKKLTEKENGFHIEITHFKKMIGLLSSQELNLEEFDLIFLDLYSSFSTEERPGVDSPWTEHKQSIHITNMKEPLWQFIGILNDIRKRHIAKNIPQPMPQVIVFSRDDKGVTVHTMFKELNAADYFFKKTELEEHKCGYYSSFRNAVICALKETVYQVGGMTDIQSRLHFNRWLRQFEPCDRPVILHLMKHFKYFSAVNIMKLLDSYLTLEKNTRWEGNAVSILNSSPRKPGRFYISYLGHPNKSGPTTMALLSKTKWLRELRKDAEKHKLKELPKFLSYEDLLQCIVEDILAKDDSDAHLCLVLIDDFIGSGGQLEKYFSNFIRDLKSICEKLFVKSRSKGGVWKKVKGSLEKNIEIMAVFALGLHNENFKSMIPGSKRENDKTHSISGTYNFEPKNNNGDNPQTNEKLSVPIQIHVAHYTRNIKELFDDNEVFFEDIKETLKKYSVIKEDLRDEDYPCDFEPLGWKENGGLIANYANAQGNTIPVIWRDYRSDNDLISRKDGFSIKEWFALYPRYFNLLTPGKKQDKNERKDIENNNEDDEKKLACKNKKEPAVCPINPEAWNQQFFDNYWKNQNNVAPPCKIKN